MAAPRKFLYKATHKVSSGRISVVVEVHEGSRSELLGRLEFGISDYRMFCAVLVIGGDVLAQQGRARYAFEEVEEP
jgi:hypothetical protein